MVGKRGQNSTIGVTIAIILGIALIVFLIWGFSSNWSMFRSTGGAYTGSTNIDSLRQACQIQCDSGFSTEYCSAQKELIDVEGEKSRVTCAAFMQTQNQPCTNPQVRC